MAATSASEVQRATRKQSSISASIDGGTIDIHHLEHGLESFCRAPARRRPHRR
jgi:hypothetical protein